ncbi:hypothetical protein FT643_19430 [Ketobacter sp. MCCC 1A13808]|nr:hypothetical protein [Ketobacter sp. MCCC 1A13808]
MVQLRAAQPRPAIIVVLSLICYLLSGILMYRLIFCLMALSWGVTTPVNAAAENPSTGAELQLLASVRPIALMVQELTQNTPVRVTTLLPEGATPHDYALKPSDLKAIQQADLLVWLGPQGEPYLDKVAQRAQISLNWESVPGLKTLSLRDAMHDEDHQPDQQERFGHNSAYDLHFWFNTENALLLAQAIREKIVAIRPELAPSIAQNLEKLNQSLQQQNQQTRSILSAQGQPFLLAHDAYQYLEAELGIHSVGAVVLNPDVKPGAKHLMELKQAIGMQKVGCVITGPEVSPALLDKIDSNPPMIRVGIDPLAWDFEGDGFSLWLASVYVKVVVCTVAGVEEAR